MAKQQNKPNANELWLYFQSVISWVKATFPKYRREMKGVAWGELYNAHKGDEVDSAKIEKEVARLMADDDVTNKKGTSDLKASALSVKSTLSLKKCRETIPPPGIWVGRQ